MKYLNLISKAEIPVIILILCLPIIGILSDLAYTTMLVHGIVILGAFHYALSRQDSEWFKYGLMVWVVTWFITLVGIATMMLVMDYDKILKDTKVHDISLYVDKDTRIVTKDNTIIDISPDLYLVSKANKCTQLTEQIFMNELKVFDFYTSIGDYSEYKCTAYKTKSQLPEVEF